MWMVDSIGGGNPAGYTNPRRVKSHGDDDIDDSSMKGKSGTRSALLSGRTLRCGRRGTASQDGGRGALRRKMATRAPS